MTTIKCTRYEERHDRGEFEATTDDGLVCRFTIWRVFRGGNRHLSSFGGTIWPGSLPDVFGVDRPTAQVPVSVYVRDGVELPRP